MIFDLNFQSRLSIIYRLLTLRDNATALSQTRNEHNAEKAIAQTRNEHNAETEVPLANSPSLDIYVNNTIDRSSVCKTDIFKDLATMDLMWRCQVYQ